MSKLLSISHKKQSHKKQGLTLLEVLISIGILAVGLLGVVALIPVGHFSLMKTTMADRSTACAKSAKVQMELRGLIDMGQWSYYNPTSSAWVSYYYTSHPGVTINLFCSTVVFDPLGCANAIYDGQEKDASIFPMQELSTDAEYVTLPRPYLDRVTTPELVNSALSNEVRIKLNEIICLWADDSEFSVDEGNPDLRARQVFVDDQQNVGPYPTRLTDEPAMPGPPNYPCRREIKGHYSWFATITPDLPEGIASATTNIAPQTYEVSIAVCHKRVFDFDTTIPPLPELPKWPERMANIGPGFFGISGSGSSDIPLQVPAGAGDKTAQLEYLKVKTGQWIMLVGDVYPDTPSGVIPPYRIARWYRVVSVDDDLDAAGNRWISVTGPEWEIATAAVPGSKIYNTRAILVDGVIGVFTETMTVDR